ncbi:MAG: hypothetical protein M1832_003804 [Thelocarpon impressellum]|nr:MAG: hypothetical protein M1832_003804 [Thelocarpon impressellum]
MAEPKPDPAARQAAPPPYDPPVHMKPPATSEAPPAAAPATKISLRAPPPFEHPTLLGLRDLEVIPSLHPEDLPKTLSPFEYVLETATRKAMAVYGREIDNESRGEPALVLAADTVVVSAGGSVLEKPRSEREHVAMLKTLREGGTHQVYTAVAAMVPLETARQPGYVLETTVEETVVRFDRDVTDAELLAYVRTREGADKAGGYAIQGIGAFLVERIDGSHDNVVGLPVRATLRLVEKALAGRTEGGSSEEGESGEEGGEEGEDEGETGKGEEDLLKL